MPQRSSLTQAEESIHQQMSASKGNSSSSFTIQIDLNNSPKDADNWIVTGNGQKNDVVAKPGETIEWTLINSPQKSPKFTIVFKGCRWPFVGAQQPLKYPGAGPQMVATGTGWGDYDYSINVNGVVLDPRVIGPGPGGTP